MHVSIHVDERLLWHVMRQLRTREFQLRDQLKHPKNEGHAQSAMVKLASLHEFRGVIERQAPSAVAKTKPGG